MKSKERLSFMVIFTMMLFFTTMTARGAEESQTIYIEFYDDDGFITETGAHFPGQTLVTILDPNMDIHSYLVFRMVEINTHELLTNATLRLRTASSLPFDADSMVTIYGVKDGDFPGFSSPQAVPSYPLTTAHVNYNTSQFYGSSWKEIDVTNIVAELKSDPSWEGDSEGFPGTFGFIIEGAEGHDTRYFYDLGSGNGLEAQLVIHWGAEAEEPPPDEKPPDHNTTATWTYVNTTSIFQENGTEREVNIWIVIQKSLWLNFSTFEQHGTDDRMSEETDTFFQMTNYLGEDDTYYRRNFTDDGTGLVALKFGITWEGLPWNGPASYGFYGIWGLSDIHGSVDGSVNEGYAFSARTWSDHALGTAWSITGGSLTNSAGWFPDIWENGLPYTHYYNLNLDMNTRIFNITVFNDMNMTDLNYTNQQVFAGGPVYSQDVFAYEYIYQRFYDGASPMGMTGKFLSNPDPELDEAFYLVWPNGTILDGPFDTEDDALEELEELFGVNPLDPDPPSQDWDQTGPFTRFRTRLYIFLMGFVMLVGPVMFFAYRRPDGYNFVVGLFIMLIGVGFLIAAGSV